MYKIARPEPENVQSVLKTHEILFLFERAKLPPPNNEASNIIKPKSGEIYIFNKRDGKVVRKSRRTLGECDGAVWRNNGGHESVDWHTMYYVADKDGAAADFRKTIYWSTKNDHAIIHYRGNETELTPKVRARGRPRVAVIKAQNVQNVTEEMLQEVPLQEGDGIFAPSGTVHRNVALRERAGLRPFIGEKIYHKAVVFDTQQDIGKPLTNIAISSLFNETDDKQFQECDQHLIAKPLQGQVYLFNVPEHMRSSWEKHLLLDGYKWSHRTMKYDNKASHHTKKYLIQTDKENSNGHSRSPDFQRHVHYSFEKKKIIVHYLGIDTIPINAVKDAKHASRFTTLEAGASKFCQVPESTDIDLQGHPPLVQDPSEIRRLESVLSVFNYGEPTIVNGNELKSIVMIDDFAIEELKHVIAVAKVNSEPIIFDFDTSLTVNGHHIGILSVKHNLLQHSTYENQFLSGRPHIPVAGFISQSDLPPIQHHFLQQFQMKIDQATNGAFLHEKKILIVNSEVDSSPWFNQQSVFCWNGILSEMKKSMQEMGLIEHYDGTAVDFLELAQSESLDEFDAKKQTLFQSNSFAWKNDEFKDYFEENISDKLRDFSALFHLQQKDIATNNIIEIKAHKKFQQAQLSVEKLCETNGKQMDMTDIITSFGVHVRNQINQCVRAYYNQSSDYTLKPENCHLSLPASRMPDLRPMLIKDVYRSVEAAIERAVLNDAGINEGLDAQNIGNLSTEELTAVLLKNGIFKFVPDEKRCLVIDSTNKTNSVWYGDSNGCSCEKFGYCEHIRAVTLKRGLPLELKGPKDRYSKPNKSFPIHPRCNTAEGNVKKRWASAIPLEEITADGELFHNGLKNHIEQLSYELTLEMAPFARPELTTNQYQKLMLSQEGTSKTIHTAQDGFGAHAGYLQTMNAITVCERLNKDSLIDNQMHLNVGEIDKVNVSENEQYAFKCVQPREVILLHKGEASEESISFAAQSVQHHIIPEEEGIKVGLVQSDNPGMDINNIDQAMEINWKTLYPICHCRKPTFLFEAQNLMQCKDCLDSFHKECVPFQYRADFTCAECKIPNQGAKWGAGAIKNTCTIDNALTSIVLESKKDNNLYRKIRSCNYASKNIQNGLKKTLDFAMKGKWGPAQETWNSLRLKEAGDRAGLDVVSLEGTPQLQFYNLLPEGGTLTTSVRCTSCRFKERSSTSHIQHLRCNLPLKSAIEESLTTAKLDSQCPKCDQRSLEQQPIFKPGEKEPWYLHYDVEASPYTLREALTAPRYITLPSGTEYKLSNITICKPGHFTSVIYYEDQFLYYDGLNDKRITKVPDQIMGGNFDSQIINSITYVWNNAEK